MRVFLMRILFSLFLLISTFFTGNCNSEPNAPILLEGEWEYFWDNRNSTSKVPLNKDNWQPYKIGSEPANRENHDQKYLWLRRIIPSGNFEQPHVLFRQPLPILEVYLDDLFITKFGYVNSTGELEYNLEIFPVVKLPPDYVGRHLYVKMYSQRNLLLGFGETPLLGNYKDIIGELVRANLAYFGLGFLFASVGFFSIYFFLIRQQKILISFALMCLSTGIIYVIQSGFFGIIWYENAPLVLKAYTICLLITPIGSIGLFYNLFGRGFKNINIYSLFVYAGFVFVLIPLVFFEITPIQKTILFVTVASFPILFYQMIVSWMQVQLNHKYALYYAVGVTTFGLANLIDFLSGVGMISLEVRFAPQGFFVMIACFSLLLEKNIRTSEKELASFEKELNIAARIQKAIIPQKTPDFSKLQFESYYRPIQKVGGDFFDYVEIADGVYGFLIADVSGHGVGASIIAAMSRIAFSSLHAYAYDPPTLLKKMNQSLMENYTGQFITAGYLVVDTKKKKLFYSSAGHYPIFIVRELGESQKLKPKGKPLGITPDLKLEVEELSLEKGMRIMMYTDGLTDMSLESWDSYGEDTIFFTLCSSYFPRMSIVDLKDKFTRDILEIQEIFPDGIQDDITFLIIEIGKI